MSPKAPTAFLRRHYDGSLALFLYHIESEIYRRLPAAIRHYKRQHQIASGKRLPPATITHVRKTLKISIRVELLAKDGTMPSKMPQQVLQKQLAAAEHRVKSIRDSSDKQLAKERTSARTYAEALVNSETDFSDLQLTLAAKNNRIAELEKQLAAATALASVNANNEEKINQYKKFASDASRSRNAALSKIKDLEKANELQETIHRNQISALKKPVRHITTQTETVQTPAETVAPVSTFVPSAVTKDEIKMAIENSSSPIFGLVGDLDPSDFPEYEVYDPDLVDTESVTHDEAMMSEYGDEQFRVMKNYQQQIDGITASRNSELAKNQLFAQRNTELMAKVQDLETRLAAKSSWF